MKKSLIALAVLAASGAALAQSSVTVYGRVDASIGSSTVTTDGVKAASTTQLFNGNNTGSRWGLMGTEDLGGGLKAVFNVENRFNVDTGLDTSATQSSGFTGNAYVGLEGGFGKLHLGRTYTAMDGVKALSVGSSALDTAFTPNAISNYLVRGANGVKYVSPDFSGLTVTANVALSEVDGTDNAYGISLNYAGGPLKVALGYESNDAGLNGNTAGAATTAANTGSTTALTGAYDFGTFSVSGGYGSFDSVTAGTGQSGFNLGVAVPVGAMKFSVGIRSGKTEVGGAKATSLSGWGVIGTYSLSKRTTAYAGYSDIYTKATATGLKTGTKMYAVGVRHDF